MKISFLYANSTSGLKKLGGEIIKSVENTPFCHFAILFNDNFDEYIFEAVFPKTRKVKYSEWLKEYSVHTRFDFEIPSQDKRIECYEYLELMINKWYGVDQVLFIAFCIWFKLNEKFQLKTSINKNARLICTEIGYLFSNRFFKYEYIPVNQDRIDLDDMVKIGCIINNKTEWK